MAGERNFDDIKRSTPEQEAEHRKWAKVVLGGATLRQLRELKGKTQAEVGAALGVTQVQAGRIEAGGDEMQLSTVRRYLETLGLELEGLQVRDRSRDYIVVTVKLPAGPSPGRDSPARKRAPADHERERVRKSMRGIRPATRRHVT